MHIYTHIYVLYMSIYLNMIAYMQVYMYIFANTLHINATKVYLCAKIHIYVDAYICNE